MKKAIVVSAIVAASLAVSSITGTVLAMGQCVSNKNGDLFCHGGQGGQ